MFKRIHKVLGTKDFINFKLTGKVVTDHSYASGSGVYDLLKWDYSPELIDTSGLPREFFPDIVPSTSVLGTLKKDAADALGLPSKVNVLVGGVDNSCMAAGARNIREGRAYTSLGTSAWIAVSSKEPVIGERVKPFVFAHVIPEMFTSAVSIFAAGSALNWVIENILADLRSGAPGEETDPYARLEELARRSPVGANKLLFNPSLSGGSTVHLSPDIRGAFIGLDLSHGKADIARAAMEGIAMELRLALDAFRELGVRWSEMLLAGGGSKSDLWRQIFADAYNTTIIKTNIDQDAASLGAAAVAAVGTGLWKDFDRIDAIHQVEDVKEPIPENNERYEKLLPIFKSASAAQAKLGEMLSKLGL
jgi:xylulokinase